MSELLPLVMQAQQQTNWCWAAVSASVADFLSTEGSPPAPQQCDIAANVLGQISCCPDGSSDACNQDARLEVGLDFVGHLNVGPYRGTASFESIVQLTSPPFQKPIGVRFSSGAQGHFLLIVGFNDENGNRWVRVADPIYGSASYDIDEFANDYQGMSWTDTYPIR